MNTTATRIVLDTNILVAIIGKKSPFRWIFDRIIAGEFILCVSTQILLEYNEILIQKNGEVVAENIMNFLSVFPFVEKYEIYYDMNLIEADSDDNKFADCAFACGGILVSNDGHFNILKKLGFPKINLMTVSEFSSLLQAPSI